MDVYKADIISIPEGSVKRILDMNNVVLWKSNRYTPFYVEDVTGGDNKVIIKRITSQAPTINIEKSLDGKTWESMGTTTTEGLTASIPSNRRIYLRCRTKSWAYGGLYNYIDTTGNCNVGGNIMSLIYGDVFTGDEVIFPTVTYSSENSRFAGLFYGNTHIISASKLILPATTLSSACYANMFNSCTSLTTTPKILPAVTLSSDCYERMFYRCKALTTVPVLPATTMAESCYAEMFYGCSGLTTAPELPATTMDKFCYDNMFAWCTSLVTAPRILPATTMAESCYYGMFTHCALAEAPILPATRLYPGSSCYEGMFYQCRSLNRIEAYANLVNNEYTDYWVKEVSSTGTFYKKAGSTWPSGEDGIPSGWTVIEV